MKRELKVGPVQWFPERSDITPASITPLEVIPVRSVSSSPTFSRSTGDCVRGKALAERFTRVSRDSPDVAEVFRRYNQNPHSIYWINLAVSYVNFTRRLIPGTFCDVFGKIS
jgi:hypothetical protein